MIYIILIILLAIIAALNGDASGVVGILKIILGVVTIFGVLYIAAYHIWLLAVLVLGVVAWGIISAKIKK